MGKYFCYANHDKKLKFSISLSKSGVKFSGISYCPLSTRAFCLLLTHSDHFNHIYRHTLIGSWIGDRVSIGDETRWDDDYDRYLDINANIIVMLYQIDGEEQLIESASEYNGLFVQIAHLIFTRQFINALSVFDSHFGKDWTKKYKQILQDYSYYPVYDLVDLSS